MIVKSRIHQSIESRRVTDRHRWPISIGDLRRNMSTMNKRQNHWQTSPSRDTSTIFAIRVDIEMTQTSPQATSRELEDRFGALNLQNGAVGDDELEKFRKQWRDEVLKKRNPTKASAATTLSSGGGAVPSQGTIAQPPAKRTGKQAEAVVRKVQALSPERTKFELEPEHRNALSPSSQSHKSLSPSTSPKSPKVALRSVDHHHAPNAVNGSSGSNGTSSMTSKSPEHRSKALLQGLRGQRLGVQDLDAVSIYARAVDAEQAGQLNDALNLYRQAFKMDG